MVSYDISIYHSSVKQKVEEGLKIDEFEHLPVETVDVQNFLGSLRRYGYRLESETPQCKAFVKQIADCPIRVAVYDTEISFSVPYWKNSEQAIFEALQDASEMCDLEKLVIFDPQTGEWSPSDTAL